jgi:1,4-dihydroxy-2-naphthoyl-CoA synthase
VDVARAGRLHILEVQRLIRFMPKADRRRCRQFRWQL